jgi:hypothetical protein
MTTLVRKPHFIAIGLAALLCLGGLLSAQQPDPPQLENEFILRFPKEGMKVDVSQECFKEALRNHAKPGTDSSTRLYNVTWSGCAETPLEGGQKATEKGRAIHVAQYVIFESAKQLAAFAEQIKEPKPDCPKPVKP